MLLGGKGGCQQCTCVPCGECTRTCQNPHTGSAFEPVYTLYFEGAESGNVGDGYLTASGDSDTSDPYDGMDGNGPWFQQVVGTFTLDSTQTRHPCRVTVSFWRNNFVLGASTIPPPSAALTSQSVKVEVTAGVVIVGDRVISAADGEVTIPTVSIPLVTGSGDQSGNDPRFFDGSISVAPQCESATFSIRARIEWNTKKRQHVLYGLVRECYEIGTPCSTVCSGSPSPAEIYLTISNLSVTSKTGGSVSYPSASFMDDMKTFLNNTFVLTRVPNFCEFYAGTASGGECSNTPYEPTVSIAASRTGFYVYVVFGRGNTCRYTAVFTASIPLVDQTPICGAFYHDGTATSITAQLGADGGEQTYAGSFDWILEV